MNPRRKRMYIMIMLCGVLALCIDRFMVGYEPDTAEAFMTTSSRLAESVLMNDENEVNGGIPELPFPRIVQVSMPGKFVDYFTPPSLRNQRTTVGQNSAPLGTRNGKREIIHKADYLTFESTYTLDAVLLSPEFRVAIVNGRWVQFGQTIDGCKLDKLTDNIARFHCTDGNATLRVITMSSLLHD